MGAVLVGLESGGVDAVRCKLFVALLGVTGDADRADDFTLLVPDQHAAASPSDGF